MGSSSVRTVGVLPFFNAPQTATGSSEPLDMYWTNRTYEAYGSTASGSGAATVVIEVRNDNTSPWITMATISLTLGVTTTADGFASSAAWKYVRARISALSGTGAAVTVLMGSAPL